MRFLLFLCLFYSTTFATLHEPFNTLDNWSELVFPKIKKHSEFTIQNHQLQGKSEASASGIILKQTFNPHKTPILSWKWKISNVHETGDLTQKKTDDAPIRIYILFKYDPKDSTKMQQVLYWTYKKIYGKYPPLDSIAYVWANKETAPDIITSSYSGVLKLIPKNKGRTQVQTWQTHKVNILEDYKACFGKLPPDEATLGILVESDNTKGSVTAWVDELIISEN